MPYGYKLGEDDGEHMLRMSTCLTPSIASLSASSSRAVPGVFSARNSSLEVRAREEKVPAYDCMQICDFNRGIK